MGRRKAKKAAKSAAAEEQRISTENAARMRRETEEGVRRLSDTQASVQETATALSAASGVGGGSRERFKKSMSEEHKKERDWALESGASQAQLAEMEGSYRAKQIKAQDAQARFQQNVSMAKWMIGLW
jgi:hypothetical protein